MDSEDDVLRTRDALAQQPNKRRVLRGLRVADGIRHIAGPRTGRDRGIEYLHQVIGVGARRILGRKFDIIDVGARLLDRCRWSR